MYDVVIIGSGPAGLAAGIYGKRAGLSTLVLNTTSVSGGQILNTYEVDNYPGIPGVSGMELGAKLREHADKLGVEFASGRVTSIEDGGAFKTLVTRKGNFEARTVIVATGASNKTLGVPGEEEFSGMGVSYCATCDGAFFEGKVTAVVGGGDVALEDAVYLARTCEKVYLIHRRDEFRGAAVLQKQVANCANIEVIFDTVVDSINGEGQVQSLSLRQKDQAGQFTVEKNIDVDGVFIAVGTEPNSKSIAGLPEMDAAGYIVADESCVTSIPGIFAAGDVRTKQLRQVVTATADGANAITSATRYLTGL